MRRLSLLLLLFPTFLFGQQRESSTRPLGDWTQYSEHACIGGGQCPERRLRVPLEDRPVVAVRFTAHDQIGNKTDGRLRVKIDGNTIEGRLDIPRNARVFTLDIDELRGRYLVFEPVTDDEVDISAISVLYGRETGRRRRDRDWDRDATLDDGWRPYPSSASCIGGDQCRAKGNRITIALEDAAVLGIRFYAHDNIGERADGRLNVRIDNTPVAPNIDVLRNGKRHDIEVDNLRGTRLVIETARDDEVDVKDIEVLYARRQRGSRNRSAPTTTTHEGGCIGGSECGGRRAQIRVPLRGRAVASVRFYARDDIGPKAGGELRIRIDDEIITDSLDIKREGTNFTIDGKGIAGDYLILEPARDDEIEVKDIRVTFAADAED